MLKQKVLTLPEKQKLFHEFDAHVMKRKQIATIFGILEAAVSGIVNERKSIEDATTKGPSSKRQKLCLCTYEHVEAALSKWFHQAHALNMPVCSPLTKKQAVKFALKLYYNNSKATKWLVRTL